MQKSIILFLFFGVIGVISSQELPKFVPPSPEAAALAKFVNTPVNYSNGLPSITIPLYTIQTRTGLSIPISLSYHASGIRVNEHATQVGLGWKLNTGGMISSEAYGETDGYNARSYPSFISGSVDQTLAVFDLIDINDGSQFYCTSSQSMNMSYDFALQATGIGAFSAGVNKIYDTQPDIFYYETPNVSGKFVLDSNNNAHTIPYEPISIEKTAFYDIKDVNGNLFEFDELCSTEVFPNTFILSQQYVEQIKLSKITTHFGEEVNYFYSAENYEYKNPETFIDYHRIPSAGCGDIVYTDNPNPKTVVNNKRLDRIEFDNGYIEFTYSTDVNYQIQGSTDRKDLPGASALRRVVVYNNDNQVIKDFELIYSYFESSGVSSDPDKYRLKLDKVVEQGELPYEFVYNGNGSIPHRLSTQQDYWGYYGGNGGLIPEMRFQDVTLSGSDRSVNENLIKTGALEEISYPTGGKTSFYFNEVNYTHPQPELQSQTNTTATFSTPGDHTFQVPADSNNILQVHFNNDCGNTTFDKPITDPYCILTLFDNNNTALLYEVDSNIYSVNATPGQTYTFRLETNPSYPCNCSVDMRGNEETEIMVDKKTQLPGLRMDRMVKEPVTGEPITTTFDYSIPGTNRISKDVLIPTFGYVQTNVTDPYGSTGIRTTCNYFVRKGTPVISNRSTYEHVTEKMSNNGHVKYHFRPSISSNNSNGPLNLGLASSDGGELLSREVYSENNKIAYKEQNTYELDYSVNQFSNDYRSGFPHAVTMGMSFHSNGTFEETCDPFGHPAVYHYFDYNIYHFNRAWVKNTNKTDTSYYYDSNEVLLDSLVVSNDYTYLDYRHAQVNQTKVRESKGDTVTTDIKYAHDLNYAPLINQHRLAVPLETKTTVTAGTNSEVISEKTLYHDWGSNLVMPQYVQTLKGDLSPTNQLDDRIVYHDYDDHGNALEVSKADGIRIMYVWGYDNTRPIAKIEHASYATLTQAQQDAINAAKTASDNDSNGTTENTLRVELQDLRDAFPQAMVTTFTYDLLIGVTSVTDPRDYTTYYEYDAFNRLSVVKDEDGFIVSKNEYHYKSQN
ncbi:MAG: RHS repeat domain-containing protein [Bacteroidota bacterium]